MSNLKMKNPILNSDIFVPDGEAHVWEDGKIYVYGSWDNVGEMGYCSDKYHVFSSSDMITWEDHGVAFTTDQIKWATTKHLYAPDCAYKDGVYYLYYCMPGGRCGVAKSTKPYGPFEDVGQMEELDGIDPAVFIDDDGQAYIYWGQFDKVRVAKLKENMVEIDKSSISQPLSVAEHEFHEGSSVKKINGRYYYLFCDTHRHGGKATSLGYAVSDNPTSGFKYMGIIIDNFGCDPETWNNHGSMVCFQDKWYIVYHRSTHASKYSRHMCMEQITINADGTIDEVPMTASCGKAPLPATDILEANRVCEVSGNARVSTIENSSHYLALCNINSGDTVTYRYLEFDGETVFSAKIKTNGELSVEIYLGDAFCGKITAQKSDEFAVFSGEITALSGDFTLTLKFFGDFSDAALDEFVFRK